MAHGAAKTPGRYAGGQQAWSALNDFSGNNLSALACILHCVSAMRRDILLLILAATTAVLAPTALHFYHKANTLEADLAALQARLQTSPSVP